MPCWYFEKKELRNTPSFQDGIDSSTESRYRREGARFIIDAGTKMGLRYDTCATGVVYFHRFYMFHSFKEFHRYITAACCLFLAGKVEETPKKCRDIIKICQNLLSPQLFTVFGEDPREEVMTLERILLQTIKFDLQVEHPYSTLLKFAKVIKGDKEKIQKLVQMAWTFINDSLCTTLSLQWEPEIISVSLMYLGTRLTKFDIQDWHGRVPGTRLKWWEFLVEDITVELMEDICHRVLDLYSSNPQSREDSPPMTPPKKGAARDTPPPPPPAKRSGPNTPAEILPEAKVVKKEPPSRSITPTPSQDSRTNKVSSLQQPSSVQYSTTESGIPVTKAPVVSGAQQGYTGIQPPAGATSNPDFSNFNPYMPSQMFSSSFMSQEGSKSIQTLMSSGSGGNPPAEGYGTPTQQVPPVSQYPAQPPQYQQQYTQQNMYSQQPPSSTAQYQQPPPTGVPYTMPQPGSYPPPVPSQPYSSSQNMPHGLTQPGYPGGTYPQNFQQPPPQQYQYPPGQQQNYQPPPFGQNMPQGQHYHSHRVPNPGIPVSTPPRGPRVAGQQQQPQPKQTPPSNANSGLTVRISGRR